MSDKFLVQIWDVVDRSGDKYRFRTTATAAEAAYQEQESGLLIGHCKAIIEGFCKSLLDEKGIEYPGDSKIGWLAKRAIQALDVAQGVENEKKARDAFKSLITSFAANMEVAAKAVGELRNDFCPLAHGKSNIHKPLDIHYAEFIGRQTDSLVGFIYELAVNHRVLEPELAFQDNSDFNDYLDDEFEPTVIYDDTYLPSEILYNLKTDKYRDALKDFREGTESDEVTEVQEDESVGSDIEHIEEMQ